MFSVVWLATRKLCLELFSHRIVLLWHASLAIDPLLRHWSILVGQLLLVEQPFVVSLTFNALVPCLHVPVLDGG